VKRVKKGLDDARPQFAQHASDIEERWEEDTLHFAFSIQGKRIEGTLEVQDSEFVLDAKLPLMWRMFEGRIEKMIQEQTKQMLG
jgi:hypothetical protein